MSLFLKKVEYPFKKSGADKNNNFSNFCLISNLLYLSKYWKILHQYHFSSIFLDKINYIDINSVPITWFRPYFSGRTQFVQLNFIFLNYYNCLFFVIYLSPLDHIFHGWIMGGGC